MYLFCHSQLKSRLLEYVEQTPALDSGDETQEEDLDEPPTETAEPSTSQGTCTVRRKLIPAKSKKNATPHPVTEDTAEVADLIRSLQTQQQRSDAIQGHISGLLSHQQASATAVWCNWLGTMAVNFDPTILPRFYRASFDMIMNFYEESRQLQFVPNHIPQQQQQQQSTCGPFQQQLQEQEQPVTPTYAILQPQQQEHQQPLHQLEQQQQPQQQQQTSQSLPLQQQSFFVRHGTSWDILAPTPGQNVPSAPKSSHESQPPRPASTPSNLSSFQLPSVPDFSSLQVGTPSPAPAPSPVGRAVDTSL